MNILAQPQAIIAIENNFDCSKTITQQQEIFPAGTGYTIQLANTLNNTDVRPGTESSTHVIIDHPPPGLRRVCSV